MNYYDLVLALIPIALLTLSGGMALSGMALTTAVPLASVVAVGLIGHAMFLRPPVDVAPTPGA